MKFTATVSECGDGQCSMRHVSSEWGEIEVVAPTREEAMEKLAGEIRYHLELCPCTGESYRHIEIDILET